MTENWSWLALTLDRDRCVPNGPRAIAEPVNFIRPAFESGIRRLEKRFAELFYGSPTGNGLSFTLLFCAMRRSPFSRTAPDSDAAGSLYWWSRRCCAICKKSAKTSAETRLATESCQPATSRAGLPDLCRRAPNVPRLRSRTRRDGLATCRRDRRAQLQEHHLDPRSLATSDTRNPAP
jgi:hypothetical protein